ncbi:arsenic resistance protein [Natribacillus halophilus]|uniref:Arsenite efflux pump ArsB, ACR3 family n=1 Tax=Natribacillus halophilus TaxID=549003 RepID=A0A1G8M816_9BACI|nr:arsenic resistance protein [Natribacillus halophilus]SDI64106.1 Arsenite efflux pump ArsB, ACR3 family [Natribacillus halophilus]
MSVLERWQTVFIMISIGVGLLLGQAPVIQAHAEPFILPFLMLMLYSLFLAIPVKEFKTAFANLTFASSTLAINFLWSPLLAWGLGAVFLSEHPAVWLGFIMLMVTPCTDWYLLFTGVAKGNVPLSTSILPMNLFLQILLLPVYLSLFAGESIPVDFSVLLESILFVFAVPLGLAMATRFLLRKRRAFFHQKMLPFFANGQMIFLVLAITAMFASQGHYLLQNAGVILLLLVPILFFFMINFFLGRFMGQFFNFSYEDTVSLNMTIIARNSPVALAIAVSAFPGDPLIALTLVIGSLIELPVLAVVSHLLLRRRNAA